MQIELRDVRTETLENGMRVIVVEQWLTLDDGTGIRGMHTFPEDTLEWRAAEYGIDPADTDTLLDIVLWEPHLPPPDQPELLLYDAPDQASAREYHLSRVAARKGGPQGGPPVQTGKPDDVRGRIVALSRMNPEALELKKVLVDEGRKGRANERARLARMAMQPPMETARVARLKGLLERPQGRPAGRGNDNGKGQGR